MPEVISHYNQIKRKPGYAEEFAGLSRLTVTQQSATSGGLWGVMDGAMIEFLGDVAYLFGGWEGSTTNDDWASGSVTNLVYRSEDFGVTWVKIRNHDLTPDATHFIPCHYSAHCVHEIAGIKNIYLAGGDPSTEGGTPAAYMHSEVRRTTDGITWSLVAADGTPGWDGLCLAAMGSLDGNLYIAGGHITPGGVPDLVVGTATNEVWKSTDDGATWVSMGNAPWPAGQCQDRLPLHNGLLWRVGGGKYDNDNELREYDTGVWSFDGTTWTEVLADGLAPWLPRFYANVFAHDGWLYISRGTDHDGNRSDTWRSRDGITWMEVDLGAGFIASHADGLGVHADGFLQATGNGRFTNQVNTNSPTFWVTPAVGPLVNTVVDIARDTIAATVPAYAGEIIEGYTEGTTPRRIVSGINPKTTVLAGYHYDGTEENVFGIGLYSYSADNSLYIGGGMLNAFNSCTQILVHIAPNKTTIGGSDKNVIDIGQSKIKVKYSAIMIGCDEGIAAYGNLTANTPKLAGINMPSYADDGTGQSVSIITGYASTTEHYVFIGGGEAKNAATAVQIYVAASPGTVAGTLMASTTINGTALGGKLAVGKTAVPTVYTIDAEGAYFAFGGDDNFANDRTPNTNQMAVFVSPTYAGSLYTTLMAYSDATTNYLEHGGGNGSYKAATLHRFWATATPNSGYGTQVMSIDVGKVRADVPLELATYTTGTRPAATTLRAGGCIYDTTLGLPIWSDASVYKDAAGNTV